jgi:hypothetical protein
MIHPVVLYQYIIIQIRQQTQQYLEIVILVNIQGVTGGTDQTSGVFLRSNYTNITQNTYIQSSVVTEILAREKCGLLSCLRTVLCP